MYSNLFHLYIVLISRGFRNKKVYIFFFVKIVLQSIPRNKLVLIFWRQLLSEKGATDEINWKTSAQFEKQASDVRHSTMYEKARFY